MFDGSRKRRTIKEEGAKAIKCNRAKLPCQLGLLAHAISSSSFSVHCIAPAACHVLIREVWRKNRDYDCWWESTKCSIFLVIRVGLRTYVVHSHTSHILFIAVENRRSSRPSHGTYQLLIGICCYPCSWIIVRVRLRASIVYVLVV